MRFVGHVRRMAGEVVELTDDGEVEVRARHDVGPAAVRADRRDGARQGQQRRGNPLALIGWRLGGPAEHDDVGDHSSAA